MLSFTKPIRSSKDTKYNFDKSYKELANQIKLDKKKRIKEEKELAKQMKYAVREMIDKGQSDEEILNFFTERYGVSVLAAPPKEGFHLFAWWTPIGIVFVGITLTFIFIRSKTILKFNNQQIHMSKDFMSSQEFQESLESIEKTTLEFNSDITKEKE